MRVNQTYSNIQGVLINCLQLHNLNHIRKHLVQNMKIKFLKVYVGIESKLNQLANLNITEREAVRAEKLWIQKSSRGPSLIRHRFRLDYKIHFRKCTRRIRVTRLRSESQSADPSFTLISSSLLTLECEFIVRM